MTERANRSARRGITPLDAVVAFASRHRLRGAARLRRMLRGHHDVTLTRVQTTDGLLFDIDVENVLDYAVLDHGYYEREVLDAITARLLPNDVVWDVGANIGLHAITAKRLRPDVVVVAFEPAPHTAARLMSNAGLNGVDIQVVTAALAETDGVARLSVVLRGNNGLSSLRPWPDVQYDGTIMCPCVRADALITRGALPAPTVAKLDVEGLEAEVLRGFGSLLSTGPLRLVVFEAPGDAVTHSGRYPVFDLLTRGGSRSRRSLPPMRRRSRSPQTSSPRRADRERVRGAVRPSVRKSGPDPRARSESHAASTR